MSPSSFSSFPAWQLFNFRLFLAFAFLTLFHSFVNSNRRNACSRSPEMQQQDNITSTWWLRITFPCQNGSSQVLHSPPWAPSLCTSRSLVRLSAKYGNQGSFIVFLIPPGASKARVDLRYLKQRAGKSFVLKPKYWIELLYFSKSKEI